MIPNDTDIVKVLIERRKFVELCVSGGKLCKGQYELLESSIKGEKYPNSVDWVKADNAVYKAIRERKDIEFKLRNA